MCKVVCFDLDDTLYKEIDYLKAAYRLIAREVFGEEKWQDIYCQMLGWYEANEDVFAKVVDLVPNVEKIGLLNMYRYDVHELCLPQEVECVLTSLKRTEGVQLGLITDGRALTQRNKIESLGLDRFFDKDMIVISEEFGSEKPALANYEYFTRKFPQCNDFTYVGDNPKKDFIAPNTLGWTTECLLDDGRNIHKQNFEGVPAYARPVRCIGSLCELLI